MQVGCLLHRGELTCIQALVLIQEKYGFTNPDSLDWHALSYPI
jgi:hypothetical protein